LSIYYSTNWNREKWFEKIRNHKDSNSLTELYLEYVFNLRFLKNEPIQQTINEVMSREIRNEEIIKEFERAGIKREWPISKNYSEV